MDLSIVIPVYNEGRKIGGDLDAALHFIREQKIAGEIIVVNDGSTDNCAEVVLEYSDGHPGIISLISYGPNRGKGYAVKQGMLKAIGKIIVSIDSGNCIPYSDLLKGMELIGINDTDIAHGSRRLRESRIMIPRKLHRTFFSTVFMKFIRLYLHLPSHLTDTQCGLKMYRKDVAHFLYNQCQSAGFMYDIEIIMKATLNGYRIKEFPVIWTPDPDSRLKILSNLIRLLKEIHAIKKDIKGCNLSVY